MNRKEHMIAKAYNRLQCKLLRNAVKDFQKEKLSGRKLEKICWFFGFKINADELKKIVY